MNAGAEMFDAIVIGGGPAGASTAIRLAHFGWEVALVEKHDFPRRKVCGECLAASNLPLLDALGVGDTVRRFGGPLLRRLAVLTGRHRVVAELPPCREGRYPWGIAVGRERLDDWLLAAAREIGVEVYQPWTVRSIERGPDVDGVTARAPDGRELYLAAPVVIDAHGSWLRAPDGGADDEDELPGKLPSDLLAFKANFTHAALSPGVLSVLAFDGGYGGMVLEHESMATFAFCMRRDRVAACRRERPRARATEAAVEHVLASCAGAREALGRADLAGAWLAAGPLRPGIRLHPRAGFLVGNAAGEAHPIIGEGLSMALQSGWLLGTLLGPYRRQCREDIGGDFRLSLNEVYARAWHGWFAARIRLAALFAQAAMRPWSSALLLPLLKRHPHWLTEAARRCGKVAVPPLEEDDDGMNDIKAASQPWG